MIKEKERASSRRAPYNRAAQGPKSTDQYLAVEDATAEFEADELQDYVELAGAALLEAQLEQAGTDILTALGKDPHTDLETDTDKPFYGYGGGLNNGLSALMKVVSNPGISPQQAVSEALYGTPAGPPDFDGNHDPEISYDFTVGQPVIGRSL